MEFSEKLKTLRIEADLTQSELANKLFLTRQAISNYEQGRCYPSIDTLVEMCKLFNTDLDALLSCGVKKRYMLKVVIASSLLFVSMLLSVACVYVAALKNLSLAFYTVTGIAIHIIPFMCFLTYLIFQYGPPKRANKFFGYRTKLSMSNKLTWDYAQTYFSAIYANISMILLGLNVIFTIISTFIGFTACLIVFCIITCVQAVCLLVPVIFTERKLKTFSK